MEEKQQKSPNKQTKVTKQHDAKVPSLQGDVCLFWLCTITRIPLQFLFYVFVVIALPTPRDGKNFAKH